MVMDPLGWVELMSLHEIATHLDIIPVNSKINVPAMFWDDSRCSNVEHSAMHGYNGTSTKSLVKPAAIIKFGGYKRAAFS